MKISKKFTLRLSFHPLFECSRSLNFGFNAKKFNRTPWQCLEGTLMLLANKQVPIVEDFLSRAVMQYLFGHAT